MRASDAAGNLSGYSGAASATTPTAPPATGPVAAYAFSEGSGSTVADASGNNNTGTLGSGVSWTAQGMFGSALAFDGTGFVTIPHSASLNLTNMTLEAWVFPTASPTDWSTVLLKEQTGALAYALYNNDRPYAKFNTSGSASGERNVRGPGALALNAWTHLAGTYDGATLCLYANGVLVATRAVSGAIVTSTGALRIGGNSVWGEFFQGRIDEVRLYNRALTQAEIQADANTPAGPPPDTTLPTAPTGLSATAVSTSQINLAWTASTDNVGVTGYRVERCQGAGCTSFAQIATPTATSFNDTGLTAATSYSYRVRAADAAGNLSAYSNVASATTNSAQIQGYYIHPDHLNTPRLIADSTGTTVWKWDQQEPFGSTPPNDNPSGLGAFDFPLRFPGVLSACPPSGFVRKTLRFLRISHP